MRHNGQTAAFRHQHDQMFRLRQGGEFRDLRFQNETGWKVYQCQPGLFFSGEMKREFFCTPGTVYPRWTLFSARSSKALSVRSRTGRSFVLKNFRMQEACQPDEGSGDGSGLPQQRQFILPPPGLIRCRCNPCRRPAASRSGHSDRFSSFC